MTAATKVSGRNHVVTKVSEKSCQVYNYLRQENERMRIEDQLSQTKNRLLQGSI